MTDIVNGLAVTRRRRAFCNAVNEKARVIRYHSTGEAWDNKESRKVTDQLETAFHFGWVEPIPEEELWPGASLKSICTYYRLTDYGRAALRGGS